ncbi:MAG: type I 3-dehydroquinate dehydratase [Thaumarchaeota archaeon]|nr:MAG: type I 3-dehydroquinate dehydratase [Nitrososphaerota archaeon]
MANKTCVTVAVSSPAKLTKTLNKVLANSDYAELRLDFLSPSQIPYCLNLVKKHLRRCICTLRPRWEGGRFRGSEEERTAILKLIAEFNPYLLDIEYKALKNNKRLYRYLRNTKTNLLVSWHDFSRTPDDKSLKSTTKKMSRFSNNIKVVTTAKTINDTIRVLALYKKVGRRANLIAFAMGDYGRMSRILCTKLGSPFTYVSLGKPVAPGQFSLNEMKIIFKLQK